MSIGKYSPIVSYFSTEQLNAAGYDMYGYSVNADGTEGPDPMGYTEDDYLQASIECLDDDEAGWQFNTTDHSRHELKRIIDSGVLPAAAHPLPDYLKD